MIRINKEMSWDDVMQQYHDRDIFGIVLEHEKAGRTNIPKTIFLKTVIENRDDLEEIDQRIFLIFDIVQMNLERGIKRNVTEKNRTDGRHISGNRIQSVK